MLSYYPNFRLWRSASCFCLLSCINRWCHWEGEKVGSNLIRSYQIHYIPTIRDFTSSNPLGIHWCGLVLCCTLHWICSYACCPKLYIYTYVWIVWRLICIHPMYYCGKRCREKLCKNWLLTLWGRTFRFCPTMPNFPNSSNGSFWAMTAYHNDPVQTKDATFRMGAIPRWWWWWWWWWWNWIEKSA